MRPEKHSYPDTADCIACGGLLLRDTLKPAPLKSDADDYIIYLDIDKKLPRHASCYCIKCGNYNNFHVNPEGTLMIKEEF
jgi:hypothetical protein